MKLSSGKRCWIRLGADAYHRLHQEILNPHLSRRPRPDGYEKYKNFVDEIAKAKNRVKARVRAKVEHPFRILKRVFGFEKVRYRGLKKNHERLCAVCQLCSGESLSAPQAAGGGEGVVSVKSASGTGSSKMAKNVG